MVKDSLVEVAPAETAIGRPTATARRLVNASLSDNTRRAYAGALGQLDAWLDGLRLDDAALAAHGAAGSHRQSAERGGSGAVPLDGSGPEGAGDARQAGASAGSADGA